MSDLSDPMDCNLPGSSAHGIFQARVLEWGAIAFSKIYLYLPVTICLQCERPGFDPWVGKKRMAEEKRMATQLHSRILAWRITMNRGGWLAAVHGVTRVGHY